MAKERYLLGTLATGWGTARARTVSARHQLRMICASVPWRPCRHSYLIFVPAPCGLLPVRLIEHLTAPTGFNNNMLPGVFDAIALLYLFRPSTIQLTAPSSWLVQFHATLRTNDGSPGYIFEKQFNIVVDIKDNVTECKVCLSND